MLDAVKEKKIGEPVVVKNDLLNAFKHVEPNKIIEKGLFLVIDGIDLAGKDVQGALLLDYFANKLHRNAILTSEPSTSDTGKKIRQIIRQRNSATNGEKPFSPLEVQLMFTIDRGIHVIHEIEPARNEGKDVICIRYRMSTKVYGMSSGIDEAILDLVNSAYPDPSAMFLLDVDVDTALKRFSSRNVERAIFENKEFLENARKLYLRLAGNTKNCFIVETPNKEDYSKVSYEEVAHAKSVLGQAASNLSDDALRSICSVHKRIVDLINTKVLDQSIRR